MADTITLAGKQHRINTLDHISYLIAPIGTATSRTHNHTGQAYGTVTVQGGAITAQLPALLIEHTDAIVEAVHAMRIA